MAFAIAVVEGDAAGGAVAVGDEDAGVVCGHRGLMFNCCSLLASVPIARVGRLPACDNGELLRWFRHRG